MRRTCHFEPRSFMQLRASSSSSSAATASQSDVAAAQKSYQIVQEAGDSTRRRPNARTLIIAGLSRQPSPMQRCELLYLTLKDWSTRSTVLALDMFSIQCFLDHLYTLSPFLAATSAPPHFFCPALRLPAAARPLTILTIAIASGGGSRPYKASSGMGQGLPRSRPAGRRRAAT